MTKKIKLIFTVLILSILASCTANAAIVMPFEATFHKYVYVLTKDLEEIKLENETVLIENDNYQVTIKQGTLAFKDKKNNVYYDTFGIASETFPTSGLNVSVKQGNYYHLEFVNGVYYNSELDKFINTLSAYKLNENTVRLLIVTGIDEFEIIGKIPLVLTENYILANPLLLNYYSSDVEAKDEVLKNHPMLEEKLEIKNGLYYLKKEPPMSEFDNLGLTKNTSREVALSLNYDFSSVKMILTTVDITATEEKIVLT